jgi:hypothetical protein
MAFAAPVLALAEEAPPPAAGPTVEPTALPTVTPAPPPPDELGELAGFVGIWDCQGTMPAWNGRPARSFRSQLSVFSDHKGYWYTGREMEVKPRADNPKEFETDPEGPTRLFFWSWDALLGKFVGGWLDDQGLWSTQSAPGWQNEKIEMYGHVTVNNTKVGAREAFSRPADGAFTRVYEYFDPATNKWLPLVEEICKTR